MTRRALIAGVTGLIGSNLAEHLISENWDVYGIARNPSHGVHGVKPIAADLLDPESLRISLADLKPTHVFFTTWVRRETEEENVAANGALRRAVIRRSPVPVRVPPPRYCTDNAAMIGAAGFYRFRAGLVGDLSEDVIPTMRLV